MIGNFGLFFQFGIRAAGGPAFLRRQRSAVSQLQTRTRTCNCTSSSTLVVTTDCWGLCRSNHLPRICGSPCTFPPSQTVTCTSCCGGCGCSSFFVRGANCLSVTSCSYGAFGAFTNTTSCSPANPTCSGSSGSGNISRECQTIFDWGPFTPYEEVDICVPQTPALGAGAVQIQCVPQ